MLNAYIPLSSPHAPPRRFLRVGVFLGAFLLTALVGFFLAGFIHTGFFTPRLAVDSGVSMRLTPRTRLWLFSHARELIVSETCPFSLDHAVSLSAASWVSVGDTGKELVVGLTRASSDAFLPYAAMFSCPVRASDGDIVFSLEDHSFTRAVSLLPRISSAWIRDDRFSFSLQETGVRIAPFSFLDTDISLPVPEQSLTSALPLTFPPSSPLALLSWSMHDATSVSCPCWTYTWQTPEGITEEAFVFSGDISSDVLLALASDLLTPLSETVSLERDDDVMYTALVKDALTFTSPTEERFDIVRSTDATPVASVRMIGDFTTLSTAPTSWRIAPPSLFSSLHRATSTHSPRMPASLTQFGEAFAVRDEALFIIDMPR